MMVLECAIYLTLEFSSTKSQHTALCFLISGCFCKNFSPKVVLFFIHEAECSGRGPSLSSLCRKLSHGVGRSEHSKLPLS